MNYKSRTVLILSLLLASAMPAAAEAYHEMEDWRQSKRAVAATLSSLEGYKPYALQRLEAKAEGDNDAVQSVQVPEPVQYKVNQGDTFSRIAKSFGVSITTIASANSLSDPGRLVPGQELIIPVLGQGLLLPGGKKQAVERVLVSTLTAYTAGKESTGKTPSHPAYGITASGSKVQEGRTIAVDPKVIPYGTKVYIEGVGIRTAEDTGSAIRGTRVDVYVEDLDEAIQFGRKKNVKVYVLASE